MVSTSPGGYAPLRYRVARSQDAPAVARLLLDHYGGDVEDWLVRSRAAMDRGDSLLVAQAGEDVVGYAKAGSRTAVGGDDPAPSGWYLTGAVVGPAWRRRGVARHLLSLLLAQLEAVREPVWSFANASNTASLALHRSLGFVEVLRAPVLLGEEFDGGEGVLLRKDG